MTINTHPIASPTLASAIGLALAAVLFFALSACGGGDSAPPDDTPLATGTSSGMAGNDTTGFAVLVLTLPGPVIELAAPATVEITITGSATQRLHYPAHVMAGVQLSQPLPSDFSQAGIDPPFRLSLHQFRLPLPAGRTELQAQVITRATSLTNGLSTGALAQLLADIEWLVTTATP
jgi:hypothetical protein